MNISLTGSYNPFGPHKLRAGNCFRLIVNGHPTNEAYQAVGNTSETNVSSLFIIRLSDGILMTWERFFEIPAHKGGIIRIINASFTGESE